MLVKTLLNSVEKHKGFVYEWIKLVRVGTQKQIHIKVRPGKRCKGLCSDCRTPGPTYDTLDERRFQFVPLWGIVVYFLYAMRRISCATCKAVTVEVVPWASGKERMTTSFAWFLASWARRMSWKQVAVTFGVSWDTVFAAVEKAVHYGPSTCSTASTSPPTSTRPSTRSAPRRPARWHIHRRVARRPDGRRSVQLGGQLLDLDHLDHLDHLGGHGCW